MIKNIIGDIDLVESLRGKSATFLLSMSNTDTAKIDGITQAGIPGFMYLTPTLDAEFLSTGTIRSMEDIAKTPSGIPTPAIITRSIHLLKPFYNIEFLNLGLEKKPDINHFKVHDFDINPSGSIDKDTKINAIELFEKGISFGQEYEPKSDYVILAESVPAGTTTAFATASMLGYNVDGKFSSSFATNPKSLKAKVISDALNNSLKAEEFFEKLGCVADNMLIFNAGFILGSIQKDYKLVLAGGTQMAALLLVVNSILRQMDGEINSSKISLWTTKWVAEDKNSDIKALLEMLDFKIDAYYSQFDFSSSSSDILKLYDKGEAKEGVGAGASLIYGMINGLSIEDIIYQIEKFVS